MEDDKYQKLLETIVSLDFKNGEYVQLCNMLKKIKDNPASIVVVPISIYIEFRIGKKYFTLFVAEREIVEKRARSLEPDDEFISYSIKCELRVVDYKKSAKDFITHITKYLQHALDIKIVHNYDIKEINFTLEFENINKLCVYYAKKSKDECLNCMLDECQKDHEPSSRYMLIQLFNFV